MPIALTLTQGVIAEDKIDAVVERIVEAFLARHGLAGNALMTPNVTAHVHVLPEGRTYSGGKPATGAWLETKTPSFAMADRSVLSGFLSDATKILCEESDGALSPDHVWSESLHAVDGSWNLDGTAHANDELLAKISAA